MDQGSTAFLQWLCWIVAVVSAGTALIRAGVASTAGVIRQKSGQIGALWILCAASVLTGFILAAAAVRSGS
jgi:hypothetical protein